MKKPIPVACAIIEHNQKVLVAQRGKGMDLAFMWEFPGGKMNAGELPEMCLVREIKEELNILVVPLLSLTPVTHDYGDKEITLFPIICKFVQGEIKLIEHQQIQWLHKHDLSVIDWCAADVAVVQEYLQFKYKPAFLH